LLVLGTLSQVLGQVNNIKGKGSSGGPKKQPKFHRKQVAGSKKYKKGAKNPRAANITSFDNSRPALIADTISYNPELYCPNSITYSN
jgi:hypothetical protein